MERPLILCVDDDRDFLAWEHTVLEERSFRLVTASRAAEAWAAAEAAVPDLVLLDVMMEQWDSGFQLLWRLKGDPRFCAVPTILVTSVDREHDQDFAGFLDRGAGVGVTAYLTKPVTCDGLLAAVHRALGLPLHANRT